MRLLAIMIGTLALFGCACGTTTATNPEAQPKAVQGVAEEKPGAPKCDCKKDMANCQCGHCKGTGAPCECKKDMANCQCGHCKGTGASCECEKEEKEHKH